MSVAAFEKALGPAKAHITSRDGGASRSHDGRPDVEAPVPGLSETSAPLDPEGKSRMYDWNRPRTRRNITALLTTFGRRRTVLFITVILIVAMSGVEAYSQHSHSASKPASDQAWHDLQQSMLAMHGAMSSIQPTGNDDEDFVRLMLPHHQAALDMARVELMHGENPQMRRLAQEIIADQESEIELMQVWLKQNRARKPQPISSAATEQ
ncbi:MAG TPA: DUF305 domain-containing protein [Terriglobales bacterium]|nr:DUF305 domain-containing protein [Terriglobales bacterium]